MANKNQTYRLDLHKLKDFNHDNKEMTKLSLNKVITAFVVDSASFLILDLDNFDKLLNLICYDDLVDAASNNNFQLYLDETNGQLGNKAWAYAVSPGIYSGLDFQGDGSFIVEE